MQDISKVSYRTTTHKNITVREKNFSWVDFSSATLENCTFENCTFENCIFYSAQLFQTEFTRCRFKSCVFGQTVLTNTRFVDVEFDTCRIYGATADKASFKHVTFSNVEVSTGSYNFSTWEEVRLYRFKMVAVFMERASLQRIVAVELTMTNVSFVQSAWENVTVNKSAITDCNFSNARITKAHGEQVIARRNDLEGCVLKRSDLFPKLVYRVCRVCHTKRSNMEFDTELAVCAVCSEKKNYTHANETFKGSSKSKLNTFSFEFEMKHDDDSSGRRRRYTQDPFGDDNGDNGPIPHSPYESGILRMLLAGFIRTEDGTVSDEMKSPIYYSFSALAPVLPLLDEMRKYVNSTCGTHIHVGVQRQAKDHVREYADQIFGPLTATMRNNLPETERFWGRGFNSYAMQEIRSSRYCWINFSTGKPTLEWRLPRYRNSSQFTHVIRFVRKATRLIEKRTLPQAPRFFTSQAAYKLGVEILELYQKAVAESLAPVPASA